VKFETGQNLLPLRKIARHIAHASWALLGSASEYR